MDLNFDIPLDEIPCGEREDNFAFFSSAIRIPFFPKRICLVHGKK